MTKWDSPQAHKDGSTYANQSMRYTVSTKSKSACSTSIHDNKSDHSECRVNTCQRNRSSYDQATASTVLNVRSRKPSLLGTTHGCPISPFLFSIGLQVPARAIRQGKDIKGVQTGPGAVGWGGRWDGGSSTHVYLWLIHVDGWQKPTEYCT